MTSRQQRRAQERKSRKQTARTQQSSTQPTPASQTLYPARSVQSLPPSLQTVRPRTGKTETVQPQPDYSEFIAAASLAVLFPGEDAALYRSHVLGFFTQYSPATRVEADIINRLAQLQWRLKRIPMLEAAIFALGRLKSVDLFPGPDVAVRNSLLDAHTLVSEGLALKRLHTQETRLRRFYVNDLAELVALQEQRTQNLEATLAQQLAAQPSEPLLHPLSEPLSTLTDPDGFEFSNDIDTNLSEVDGPADYLSFAFGSDFSTDIVFAGSVPK